MKVIHLIFSDLCYRPVQIELHASCYGARSRTEIACRDTRQNGWTVIAMGHCYGTAVYGFEARMQFTHKLYQAECCAETQITCSLDVAFCMCAPVSRGVVLCVL